ncbi:transglycosylase SLT domain-containing protein [Alteromonas sp. ASW11-130]|uniref:transglycosylase SLT domain-containing protein n=1 Tax=Alteromonas sp. ASW11-130 TaxID=3015775 RepID=UPI002241F44C|nr:transglycosylase SLT domain-containing protein [Alteromonas sp. ASW11-130]MCW8091899.1 transglycosylase SLT domain-containing protein [Alteromonas sp. ASW11-130]
MVVKFGSSRLLGWLSGWLLFAVPAVMANPLLPKNDAMQAQRTLYLETERTIQTLPVSQLYKVDSDMAALQSYPLYPYLVRQRLFRNVTIANRRAIESFLMAYDGHPMVYSLRAKWLRYLADNKQMSAFLASYRDNMGAEITCHYLQYQLAEASNPDYWLDKVDDLWLSAHSQPDSCNPVFKRWEEQGHLTDARLLKRIERAALSGNSRLVSYLQRSLPPERQYLGQLWLKVRNDPTQVMKPFNFPLAEIEIESRILAHGLERLAWKDPDQAVKGYYQWQSKLKISEAQWADIHRAIALSLAIDDKPGALTWLERADVTGAAQDVKRWHLAYLLRKQNWQKVLELIDLSRPQIQQQDAFRYWRARSFANLGAPEMGKHTLEELASERHYYGFMASAQLAKPASLKHMEAPTDPSIIQAIESRPSAQRAYEFLQLGRLIDARREWRYLISKLDTTKIKDAAVLASEWGWYDQAIISFTQSGYLDDVKRRFPLAFAPKFSRVGQTYDVSPAFAMAIARRESSFMVDAVSPAGATGLMQLMPGTAQYLVDKKINRAALIEPDQNVQLGVQYLRYLMDKLDNNPVLVSASYNAGWKKVLNWLPRDEALPTDVWIENIPYRETRGYVKAVLAYRYIYEQQLGTPSEIFSQLSTSSIPAVPRDSLGQMATGLQLAPE